MWRQSFPTSHKQMYIQKMSKQWQVWKTTLTSTTTFLLLNMMLYGLKHPFCEFKSAFPVLIPPNPHPTHYRVGGKKGKALTLCKHCSAIAKTLVWCQHCFRHKSKQSTLWGKLIQSHHTHLVWIAQMGIMMERGGFWSSIHCRLQQD